MDFTKLKRAFNPRSIAIVGDKAEFGLLWTHAESTFKGKLYSVQIEARTIERIKAMGVENYTSLLDIPEPVDLVIVSVPRALTPDILEDCISKEVAAAVFFTAGFSETDTEEGKRLEKLLAERAKQANFHLIGPNCMGVFNPKAGVRQHLSQNVAMDGAVGFIAQSGGLAVTFSIEADLQGVETNKSVSFGNGTVLDSADFLEFFGQDKDIKAIGMYLEGVRDGRRFLAVLREVSPRKPVVIWKGGRTSAGERATASHTGSMATSQTVWDAVIKQSGAIKVMSLEELIDTLKALLYLPPVYGSRVALVGGSGGESVAITDVFVETGLEVPPFTPKSYEALLAFFRQVGASCQNPVDPGRNWKELMRILEIVAPDANIDNIAVLLVLTALRYNTAEQLERFINSIINLRGRTAKPVMAILPYFTTVDDLQRARDMAQKLQDGGIPAFYNPERGARALRNALDYYSFKNGIGAHNSTKQVKSL